MYHFQWMPHSFANGDPIVIKGPSVTVTKIILDKLGLW